MAIYSPLRSRRLAARQTEETRRLITFKLGAEIFALPLDDVQKVTTLERLYGDPHGTGVSLTTYQGRELVVIDVGQRIFGQPAQVLPPSPSKQGLAIASQQSTEIVRYLLILRSDLTANSDLKSIIGTDTHRQQRLVGLPIDSPPSIQSIPVSAFQPLPDLYRQHSNIHCISTLSIDLPDRPSIFLLDLASIVGGES
jgi:chemotaxis signal transduction protein